MWNGIAMVSHMSDFRRIDNPYITGNPVPRGSRVFYGREDDFTYVHHRLLAEKEGIILLFVGGRRCGKTSILFQILDGRLGSGFLPIFIDMQAFSGVSGDAEFLSRMAQFTIEGASDERLSPEYYDFGAGNPILVFDRLLEDMAQVFPERRLLFLVDEAELLRDRVRDGDLSQAVLTYLASILESRSVSFCFTGSMGLASGEQSEWRRLLGKGDFKEISFLSQRDTLRLAQEPVGDAVEYGEGVLDAIYALTYGHPFYTQLICTNIVDHLNGLQRNRLEQDDLDDVVRTIVANPPPQLVYDWDQFTDQQQLVLSLLSETTQEAHRPVPVEDLVDAIDQNSYPVDLSGESMHMLLDELDERQVVDRSDDGAYHFLVDLIRLWVRRSRSIWRLVEESEPARPRRGRLVAAAAAVLALVAVGGILVWPSPQPVPPDGAAPPAMAPVGRMRIDPHPPGTHLAVSGPLGGDRARCDTIAQTPEVLDLTPGQYEIRVAHALYHSSVDTVDVRANTVLRRANQLQRLTGELSLAITPAGATVRITGEGDLPDTSLQGAGGPLVLPTGAYTVRASNPGYVVGQTSVAVGPGERRQVRLVLAANVGHLQVFSEPPGAQIWLDGEPTARHTPATLESLSVATHQVQLRRAYYVRADTAVQVRQGETRLLSVTLVQLPAALQLTTDPPGARVYIDGVQAASVTPGRFEVTAGERAVRFELDGYDAEQVVLQTGPGQERSHSVVLPRQFGWINIAKPFFGALSVDGEQVIDGPLGIRQLWAGRHVLELREYPGDARTVTITKGCTAGVRWD